MKPSDCSCIPLCRNSRTAAKGAYHRIGKFAFERNQSMDLGALVESAER